MKRKEKWMAGYKSALDWFIVPATKDNELDFAGVEFNYYDSFALAKRGLMSQLKKRIKEDTKAIKSIQKFKISQAK